MKIQYKDNTASIIVNGTNFSVGLQFGSQLTLIQTRSGMCKN